MSEPDWMLAVDFGTSNTTAAHVSDGGVPAVLQVENSPYLPSVVVADGDGRLVTGKAAVQQAVFFPSRAERVPKRALVAGDQVVLDGRAVPVTALAGAVFRQVYGEAVRFHDGTPPRTVMLTYPARWGEALQDRLVQAAALAGITDPVLIPEPVAAAWWYEPPSAGQVVAVFDLGGGTLDTAVLAAAGGRFTPAGPPGGDADLGGEDFDELLLERVKELARDRDAAVWEQTFGGEDLRTRRELLRLRADVRTAKEALSDYLSYEFPVSDFADSFRRTRPEFEALIGSLVDEAVAEMRRTITAAGVEPGQLAAVYLTGGASRVPVIATRLGQALGVVPRMKDDPKTVVALGALTAHAAHRALAAQAADPARPQPAAKPSPEAQRDCGPAVITSARLSWRELTRLRHDKPVDSVAFSPDGHLLATGSQDKLARVWDAGSGRELFRLPHRSRVESVAFSPDGRLLATAGSALSSRSTGQVWDAASGQEHLKPFLGSGVGAVAFSPDGRLLAIVGGDHVIAVFELASGRRILHLLGRSIRSVAFSPDGRLLAAAGTDSIARVWEMTHGRLQLRLQHKERVWAVAFSPDGRLLATGGYDKEAWVWEAASGRELTRLRHDRMVHSVAFSPDGQLLVTGSADKTARLWHAASWRELSQLRHGDGVRSVAFSPDGRLLGTGCWDKLAHIWQPT